MNDEDLHWQMAIYVAERCQGQPYNHGYCHHDGISITVPTKRKKGHAPMAEIPENTAVSGLACACDMPVICL